jgi:hypothetical protein
MYEGSGETVRQSEVEGRSSGDTYAIRASAVIWDGTVPFRKFVPSCRELNTQHTKGQRTQGRGSSSAQQRHTKARVLCTSRTGPVGRPSGYTQTKWIHTDELGRRATSTYVSAVNTEMLVGMLVLKRFC